MAISKTALINKALTIVGAAPITNIDDDSNNARTVSRVYDISRQSVLCECLWTFAATRCTLSLSTHDMPWDYIDEAYVYVNPSHILRIFETSDNVAKWRVEGDYIVSDTAGLGIKGVWDLDDPAKYSASFIEALIDKLCSDICYMIVNSASKAELFLKKYNDVSLPKAMSENSQTGTQQVPKDDAWEMAKYTNGNSEC